MGSLWGGLNSMSEQTLWYDSDSEVNLNLNSAIHMMN